MQQSATAVPHMRVRGERLSCAMSRHSVQHYPGVLASGWQRDLWAVLPCARLTQVHAAVDVVDENEGDFPSPVPIPAHRDRSGHPRAQTAPRRPARQGGAQTCTRVGGDPHA